MFGKGLSFEKWLHPTAANDKPQRALKMPKHAGIDFGLVIVFLLIVLFQEDRKQAVTSGASVGKTCMGCVVFMFAVVLFLFSIRIAYR